MTLTALILTEGQADSVRGTYNEIASLEPVPIGDGRYFLPLAVLNDPNFAEVHEVLSSFPIEEVTIIQEEPEV